MPRHRLSTADQLPPPALRFLVSHARDAMATRCLMPAVSAPARVVPGARARFCAAPAARKATPTRLQATDTSAPLLPLSLWPS